MRNLYLIMILIVFLMAAGCGKDKSKDGTQTTNQTTEQQTTDDTDAEELTPAEIFAASLVQDILNEENEPELEDYISGTIFPKISGSPKVTIDKISSSLFIIKYFENGAEKNLLLQKYYNPKDDAIFFESSETTFDNTKLFLK